MRLSEARELAIRRELAGLLRQRSRDLLYPVFLGILFCLFFAAALAMPVDLAESGLCRPGSPLASVLGAAGAATFVTVALALLAVLFLGWAHLIGRDVRAGLPKQRARILARLEEIERRSIG